MNGICIIPARGGSKGIPRKNIRIVAGKPLLAHSIEHALGTPAISRVMVSTDDSEIAQVAQAYGAEVIWRPAAISGDTAASEAALLHALNYLNDVEQYDPDLVAFLQATSPLRRPDDLQRAIDLLIEEQSDSLFSGNTVHGFVWRTGGGRTSPVNYDPLNRPRRQDLAEAIVEENGSFYLFKPWVLREHNSRLGGKTSVYVMHPLDSFQVDEPDDLVLIEQCLRLRQAPPPPADLARVRLLVLDFDGVMTDNRVLVDESGREAVLCHRGDGWGIARLKEAQVKVAVVSTEKNPVVAARCQKLRIDCVQGCDDKLAALRAMAGEQALEREQIAYVGNDVNDIECMQWVGLPIAVADGVPEVRRVAQLITSQLGGYGAVREVADWILAAKAAA